MGSRHAAVARFVGSQCETPVLVDLCRRLASATGWHKAYTAESDGLAVDRHLSRDRNPRRQAVAATRGENEYGRKRNRDACIGPRNCCIHFFMGNYLEEFAARQSLDIKRRRWRAQSQQFQFSTA